MRHGIRACAYPAGVAVRPTSAVAAAVAAAVVAAAAVCPSRPGAAGSAVGRHTSRPGTADITVPSSPPTTPGRGSKVNGFLGCWRPRAGNGPLGPHGVHGAHVRAGEAPDSR